jgi:hypothetical protein
MTFWFVIAALAAFMFGYPTLGAILLLVAFFFPGPNKEDK